MKFKVLVSVSFMQKDIEKFKDFFEKNNIEITLPGIQEKMTENQLLDIIEDYDGVLAGDDEFTKKVIDKAKKLKVISKWGTGIDSIDKEYAEKKGIKVCNTPNAFSEPVSDTVLAKILCFARNIIKINNKMRKGKWEKIDGSAMDELTLGIIGFGNIGKKIAEKAAAFNMRILVNDIKNINLKNNSKFQIASKEEIYKESDFISLSCDLNETSKHLIDYSVFEKMKDSAVIINTARGPVIKHDDLVRALEEKIIGGAGLDVFEFEPLVENSPLRKFENCITSPHASNSSKKYWNAVHENTLNNLLKHLK